VLNLALLSGLLFLFLLMIAAHAVFIVMGVRSLLTGLPVRASRGPLLRDVRAQRDRSGLLFVVFGCLMVAAWGWLSLRAARQLMNLIP